MRAFVRLRESVSKHKRRSGLGKFRVDLVEALLHYVVSGDAEIRTPIAHRVRGAPLQEGPGQLAVCLP